MAQTTVQDPFKTEFRNAMRRLTSTVTVITTAHGGERFGMTATAVTSVSAEPPSLLICVNRSARLHDPLIRAGRFCVNILQADQTEVAQAFSGSLPHELRFGCGDWDDHGLSVPYLRGAQANLVCETDAISSYGTHSLLIGLVRAVHMQDSVVPLLYQDGQYTVGLGKGVDWVIPVA
jgi:flavin reductase (DIM6/NTAB) family NADH-FMN oxidoreductase RutF